MSPQPPAERLDLRLIPAALTAWAVTAAAITRGVGAAIGTATLLLGAEAGVLWWCTRGRQQPGRRLVAANLVAVAAVAAGFGCAAALRADAVAHHPITAAFGAVTAVTVTPSESAVSTGGRRVMFRATLQRLDDHRASGRVVVFARASDFGEVMVGQPMRFPARIGRPTRRDLTVAVLTAAGRPTRAPAGAVHRAAHAVRARFAAAAARVLPTEQARLLPALVLGDTSAITAATGAEFKLAGLTHLMAVSGANVTIVCGAVLFSARVVGPRIAVLLAAITLVVFVVVVQPTASVLRAAVMGAIALLGVVSARRRQAIPSLAGSVLLLLIVAPQLAVDVGFALSVVATAALVVVAPVWSARLVGRGWPKPLADAVCVAWAAQLVTAPLIAAISGRVSLVSTAANLAVAALIAPITILGSLAAAACGWWPAAAQLLIRYTGPELWWVCRIAQWAAAIPGAAIAVPTGAGGAVAVGVVTLLGVSAWRWRWWRRGIAAAAIGLAGWSLAQVLTGSAAVGGA